MLLIRLDPQSTTPLFKQVFHQLKERIDSEVLKPGDRLPSSRKFSEQLGVHRTTVSKAYEELWALGYIESRQGSYSTVRKRTALAGSTSSSLEEKINWTEKFSATGGKLTMETSERSQFPTGEASFDFRPLSPDPRLMPTQEFKQSLHHVLHQFGSTLLGYGDALGYLPLRQFIAQRMRLHGITVTQDNIMLTNGAQNGIDLLLQLLVEAGQAIAIESPTYSSAIPLVHLRKANPIPIPMQRDGVNLEALETCFKESKPALFYTIPNFHNPTGITTSQEHRERLLRLCERYQVPLVEDGFEEEMKYFGKVVLPIKSMDRSGIVLYLGTFSKVLFPGLRIGWVAADQAVIESLSEIKKNCDISGNMLNQAAIHHFCQTGQYELHIRRIHRSYRKRMETALRSLQQYLPMDNIAFAKPNGGYTLWIECVTFHQSEQEIVEALWNNGVAVTPGHLFYPQTSNKKCFRISIANRNEVEIEEGFQRIGSTLNKLLKNEKTTP